MIVRHYSYDSVTSALRSDDGSSPEDSTNRKLSLAIGDFDGVHLGHREVIARAVRTARTLNLFSAVMTFHPHPRFVFGQREYACNLTPLGEKLRRFRELGVDLVLVVRFDEVFARLSAAAFVERILIPLAPDTVTVGFDFTFGFRAEATPDTLCSLASGRFAVEVVRPIYENGRKVSSSLIRECLRTGNVRAAASMLGRPYLLAGTVVRGDGRGRRIGFPTANLVPDEPYVVPAGGVYAVRATTPDGLRRIAVMNIGSRPTFVDGRTEGAESVLEVHILDFAGTLYGSRLIVEFEDYLREERRFPSAEELIRQIARDVKAAKSIVALD